MSSLSVSSLPKKIRVNQHASHRQIILRSTVNYMHVTDTNSSKFITNFIMAKLKPSPEPIIESGPKISTFWVTLLIMTQRGVDGSFSFLFINSCNNRVLWTNSFRETPFLFLTETQFWHFRQQSILCSFLLFSMLNLDSKMDVASIYFCNCITYFHSQDLDFLKFFSPFGLDLIVTITNYTM